MPGALADAKAVFFDVDNTLYDFKASMARAFAHLHTRFPEVFGGHAIDDLERAYFAHYESYPEEAKVELINRDPDLFRRTMWSGALTRLGLHEDERLQAWVRAQHPTVKDDAGDPDGFAKVVTDEMMRLRPRHWRESMYEGAAALLRDMKPRFVLGAITNGPARVQRPKLEALDYRAYFPEERTFVSGEFGEYKPARSIFLAAAKSAGVEPHECVMVGDAREYDMPAKAVGFRTVLFTGPRDVPDCSKDEHPPDAIVRDYEEMRALFF